MLNSIDFNTMLPRTAEAADVQGREVSQSQHLAHQTGVQFQQKTEQQARQTVETAKSETEEYDAKKEGNGRGNSGNRKRKKQEDGNKSAAPMAPRSNSSFDIMI